MTASFERFGPAHLGAIALTFMTPLILCAISRLGGSIATRIVRWLFVALLVGDKIFWFILLRRDGQFTIANAAPMQLCDWAAITAVITLIYPNQRTYELCYFWALGGNAPGAADAGSSYGFPDPRFISFFARMAE